LEYASTRRKTPMSFLAELKRRHVFRIAAAYVVGAWVAIQVGATVAPILQLPDWVPRLVVGLAVIGFPIALALAWTYDIGAKGLERTNPATEPEDVPSTSVPGRVSSLAVLPLEEVGVSDEDPLADGLTEALITDVARTTRLKVISRSSVARFKGTIESPRRIASLLHVDALIAGSVRRHGPRIRISVELIHGSTEQVLWTDRFDRDLEDVLRLEDDIALAIAREVNAYTSPEKLPSPVTVRRQVVPDVYLLDLRGKRLMESRTETGLRSALACFEQALDLDPTYGTALLGIARAHNMLANYGLEAPTQAHARVRTAIERARTMGADEAELLGEVAQMRWQFEFDWVAADRAYAQALALAPRNARLWYWRSTVLAVGGSFEAALESLARAEELDPLSPIIPANRGWMLYFAGHYEESVATLREVLELNPELGPAHWFLGMARVAQGDAVAAIDCFNAAIARIGRISRLLGYLGHACGRGGRIDEARGLLQELHSRSRDGYVPHYFMALVLAGLGDREAALDVLERALEQGDTMIRDLYVDASFDVLRTSPRFARMLASMQLPYVAPALGLAESD
jgi:adenylate cyclase